MDYNVALLLKSQVALETDHLTEVSNIVNRFIDGHLAVRTEVVDLDTAMEIPGLRTVQDEVGNHLHLLVD